MNQGDRSQARLRFRKMVGHSARPGFASLNGEERRDELEAVLNAMVHLLHQDVFLRDQGITVGEGSLQFVVEQHDLAIAMSFMKHPTDASGSFHLLE